MEGAKASEHAVLCRHEDDIMTNWIIHGHIRRIFLSLNEDEEEKKEEKKKEKILWRLWVQFIGELGKLIVAPLGFHIRYFSQIGFYVYLDVMGDMKILCGKGWAWS